MTEIIIELGYKHVIMHLADFGEEVKMSATQKEKSTVFVWQGILKMSFLTIS